MKKTKKSIELDVDYIGDQTTSLTKEEEKAISEFIKKDKLKKAKRPSKPKIVKELK